jgi:superfamily II DNA or RNA helicase
VILSHLPSAFGALTRERGILILVHRDELISQTRAALHRWQPNLSVGIEKGPQRAVKGSQVVIASVQTLGRRGSERAQALAQESKLGSIVVVDEAHHLRPGNSYDRVLRYFGLGSGSKTHQPKGDQILAGFTATPYRADGVSLSPFFDHSCSPLDIRWGIEKGYLVDLMGYAVETVTDLSSIPVARGPAGKDLSLRSLAAVVDNDARNSAVAAVLLKLGGTGGHRLPRAICFCASVPHAHSLAERLSNAGMPAAAIYGEMDPLKRKGVLHSFAEGSLAVLTNFGVLTEGFDAPACDTIVMCRPTLSEPLYMQMIGRGTRPLANVSHGRTSQDRRRSIAQSAKPFTRVIDFVDNCGRHNVISMAKIMGLDGLCVPDPTTVATSQEGIPLSAGLAAAETLREAEPGFDLKRVHDFRQLLVYARQYRLLGGPPADVEPMLTVGPSQPVSAPSELHKGDRILGLHVTVHDIKPVSSSSSRAEVEMHCSAGTHWTWRTSQVRDADGDEIYAGSPYVISGATVRAVEAGGEVLLERCKLQPTRRS